MKAVKLTIEVPCDPQVRVADVRDAVADVLCPLGLVRSDRRRGTLPHPEARVVGHIDFARVRLLFRTGKRPAALKGRAMTDEEAQQLIRWTAGVCWELASVTSYDAQVAGCEAVLFEAFRSGAAPLDVTNLVVGPIGPVS